MLIAHDRQARQLGGQIIGGNMSRSFVGCVLNRAALSSFTIAVGVTQAIDWAAGDYDLGGWFNPGSPTVVTVPAGVTRVRHWYSVLFTGTFTATASVGVIPFKNGVSSPGLGQVLYVPETGIPNSWVLASPSYVVVAGQTIDIRVNNVSATGNITVSGGSDVSFGIEAVTMGD